MTSYHPFYHIAEIYRLAFTLDVYNDAEMFRRDNPRGLVGQLSRLFSADIKGNLIYKLSDHNHQQIEQLLNEARSATTDVGERTIDLIAAHLAAIVDHQVTIYLWPCGTWCYVDQLNEYGWMSDDYEKVNVTGDELAAM